MTIIGKLWDCALVMRPTRHVERGEERKKAYFEYWNVPFKLHQIKSMIINSRWCIFSTCYARAFFFFSRLNISRWFSIDAIRCSLYVSVTAVACKNRSDTFFLLLITFKWVWFQYILFKAHLQRIARCTSKTDCRMSLRLSFDCSMHQPACICGQCKQSHKSIHNSI